MKKLRSILLIFSVCMVLCSCDALDAMKDVHALDYGNGIIKYNSAIYKKLDYTGNIDVYPAKYLYVTDPDVPVLLSQTQIVKDRPFINSDNTIISNYGSHYVREDKYDYYASKAEE